MDFNVTVRFIVFYLAAIFLLPAFSAWSEEIDNKSARAFNAAAALQNAGLHARAATKWQAFLSQFPDNEKVPRANYYLGVCRLREKKFDEAVTLFQSVLSRWPDFPQADKAQYNLAMARYELVGDTNDAAALRNSAAEFEKVVAKYSKSPLVPDAMYHQGDCLLGAGDVQRAVDLFGRLIKSHPKNSWALRARYDLGIALTDLGKQAEAETIFSEFLKQPGAADHPLATEVELRLAVCLDDLEKWEPAAIHFDKVSQVKDYPLADYAAFRHGQTIMRQEKYDQAANVLKGFPKKFPESEYRDSALKTAGQSYFLAGKLKEAAAVLPAVANGDSAVAAEAAYWLSRSLLKLNQAGNALGVSEKALSRFAADSYAPQLQLVRIDALYALPNRRKEAPPLYEAFWRQHREHSLGPQAGYMASFSWFQEDNFAKAIEISEACFNGKHKPEEAQLGDLQFVAAESYLLAKPDDGKARKRAETHFRSLIASQPNHPRAAQSQLRIGWCLLADQKYQEAISTLQSALAKFDKNQQLPEAHLLIGRSYARLEKHAEAVSNFEASFAANPKWDQVDSVLMEAAESYRQLNRLDNATAHLERLVQLPAKSPLRARALYTLGEIAQLLEQQDKALEWFRQAADSESDREFGGPAIFAAATIYLTKNQHADARNWATRLIDGKYAEEIKQRARYVRGTAFSREKNFDSGSNDLLAYLQKPANQPEASSARFALAVCQLGQKKYSEARKVLDQLIAADPEFANADQAFYELGHALRAADDQQDQAGDAFAWIVKNRADSPLAGEAAFRVGQIHVDKANRLSGPERQSALETADAALRTAIQKTTDDNLVEGITYLLGSVLLHRERLDEAATTLASQISRFPKGNYVGPAAFLAAQARYRLAEYDQALPLYLQVGKVSFPATPQPQIRQYQRQALYRAGDCAAKLERWQESQQLFQQLIQQHPDFAQRPEARYGLGYALQKQNKLDDAIKVYEQTTSETETETAAKARFMIGEIEFGRKRYEDAIEQFLVVTAGYPYPAWQTLARFETARCFVELGDRPRAISTLKEMIEKHGDHPRAADAKKMLTALEG